MMKIEIKTKGKEQIPKSLVEGIMEVMNKHKYKNGSLISYRICDGCECRLPNDYPKDLELCPNCENGRQDAMKGSL